jgi:hypothetical protein
LRTSQDFCQAILDDVEWHFRNRYGAKWTVELQDFFQKLRGACLESALKADGDVDRAAITPLRQAVILTSVKRG